MRNYAALSSPEFEAFVGDLMGAELGTRFERFASGGDGGIDLRHIGDGGPDVLQAKHYAGSTWSNLKSAVKEERKRLDRLDPPSATYRLVTSLGLTPARKKVLAELLGDHVSSEDDVYGREDVDDILDRHGDVERRHVKLWLASATALRAAVAGEVFARSRSLQAEIERTLPLWVASDSFFEARELLHDEHVVVISGPPGIGKTTLARMLVAEAVAEGYEAIAVSADIDEAWKALDPTAPQIFLYDDFLGQTSFIELNKNEDSRLVAFMAEVHRAPHKLFVMTTREYILQRAVQVSENLKRAGIKTSRILLELDDYGPFDRAQMLANHVWHSENVSREAVAQLAQDRGYRRIIEHPEFNPRLVEFVCGLQSGRPLELGSEQRWLDAAVAVLDRPDQIWQPAYEQQLDPVERALLLALATLGRLAQIDDLRAAHDGWCEAAGLPAAPRRFERALEVVDDSFVRTAMTDHELTVAFANPGIRDFVERQLRYDPAAFGAAFDGIVFFDQLLTLWRLTDKPDADGRPPALRAPLFDRLAELAGRLYASGSAQWIPTESPTGARRLRRRPNDPDIRLAWWIDVAASDSSPASVAQQAQATLDDRVGSWRDRAASPASVMSVARRLAADPEVEPPDGWADAAKEVIAHDPWTPEDWQNVIELSELVPGVFREDEWEEMPERVRDWAHSHLVEGAEDITSEDDIAATEELAAHFGVELEERWLETAREELGHRLAAEDHHNDMEFERWREERSERGSAPDDSAAMDRLFEGLAQQER